MDINSKDLILQIAVDCSGQQHHISINAFNNGWVFIKNTAQIYIVFFLKSMKMMF